VVVIEGVVDHLPGSTCSNERLFTEPPELVRNGRLAHPESGGEIADTHFLVSESHHEPEPRRVVEGFEEQAETVQLGRPDLSLLGSRDPIEVDDTDVTELVRAVLEALISFRHLLLGAPSHRGSIYEHLFICSHVWPGMSSDDRHAKATGEGGQAKIAMISGLSACALRATA
jgi:hypothetical protein